MNQTSTNSQIPIFNSQLPNSQLPISNSQAQIANDESEVSVGARATRLVRVSNLHAFRLAVAELACGGTPFDVRDRLVVVPTRAAAVYLTGSIEAHRLGMDDAVALPEFATRAELHLTLAQRLPHAPLPLTPAEREVLMGAACRMARDAGSEPPFRLRSGLVAAMLDFYDTLQRNLKPLDTFERLALGMLEPGAADDRGAERLVRQTRFLVAAFRTFERLREESAGVDEHLLRPASSWRIRQLDRGAIWLSRSAIVTPTNTASSRRIGTCSRAFTVWRDWTSWSQRRRLPARSTSGFISCFPVSRKSVPTRATRGRVRFWRCLRAIR